MPGLHPECFPYGKHSHLLLRVASRRSSCLNLGSGGGSARLQVVQLLSMPGGRPVSGPLRRHRSVRPCGNSWGADRRVRDDGLCSLRGGGPSRGGGPRHLHAQLRASPAKTFFTPVLFLLNQASGVPYASSGRQLGEDVEAGQGAAEQAQRIGERVSRLELELERVGAELEQARRAQQAWLAGAEGEARVGEQLRQLELQGWRMLHDVHWPGRAKANIDHIAVGPGGVLVIDAKNWSGEVRLRHGELYQNGYTRKRETASALEQCAAVSALLEPQHRSMAQGWICLVGQPDVISSTSTGVTVVGIDGLVGAVLALPAVLEQPFVTAIHDHLQGLLTGSTSPAVATTALLDRAKAESSVLAARRTAAAQSVPAGRPRATPRVRAARRPTRRSRKNQPSFLGSIWRLVLLALVLWWGAGVLQNVTESLSNPPPEPPPAVVQPDVPG